MYMPDTNICVFLILPLIMPIAISSRIMPDIV